MPCDELLRSLGTTIDGLTSADAQERLSRFGANASHIESRTGAFLTFLTQFKNPVVLILIFAAAVSAFVAEWIDAAVIIAIVLGSALLSFWQEYSAGNAAAKLRAQVRIKSTAMRDGRPDTIPVEAIVPGDVVLLSAGNLIPADGVLIEAKDLLVNQAALTGETFPVEKLPGQASADAALSERANCVFAGTHIGSGSGRMVVVNTGAMTEFGHIAVQLSRKPPETEFQRGIRHFGYLLTQVMLALTLIVFAANVFASRPPVEALLFAIALAVGISPELLPAIVSINLSKGAQRMAAQGVIVRQLESIENLGSMDTLCTDKTGTLTVGEVRLDSALDAHGYPSATVLRDAYLNASLQTGMTNPLDDALKAVAPLDVGDVARVDEVPYDFSRRRLSVIVRDARGCVMITKGAFASVLAVCTSISSESGSVPLDEVSRAELERRFNTWSDQGFRVLGLAIRCMAGDAAGARPHSYEPVDESDLVFTGFLLFFDPPKPGASKTVADLRALGVDLKVITGDNHHIATHLANAIGIASPEMLSGGQLGAMSDEALRAVCWRIQIFTEVDPGQKERIITALRKSGRVVGYLGDGINDAPALRAADVGISVDTAVDVAKEAADFVLLRQDMDVLRQGIELGRVTFANTLKYIFTTTSANFGNMFSMAGASLFLPFLPLTASQILLNNFLSDFPALAIASDNVDRDWIDAPRKWDIRFIRSFMLIFGLISSAFDYMTFGLLLRVFQSSPVQFRTAWFIESLLTELVIALVVRTRRPFFRSRPGTWLWRSTLIVAGLTIALPYLPWVGDLFGFVPLPADMLAMIIGITIAYVVAVEIAKHLFYRRNLAPSRD